MTFNIIFLSWLCFVCWGMFALLIPKKTWDYKAKFIMNIGVWVILWVIGVGNLIFWR